MSAFVLCLVQRRVEGILNVFNRLMSRLACYGNDVKPNIEIDEMIAHISIGCLHYFSYFIVCDSLYGIAITIASTSFHLHDSQRVIFLGYDV